MVMQPFPVSEGFNQVAAIRSNVSKDIVERIAVISPNKVILENYMGINPHAVFNASIHIDSGIVELYARVTIGYYSYASSIARMRLSLDSLLAGDIPERLAAELVITPSLWHDFWGSEDPRVYTVRDRVFMTYTGRTRNYYKGQVFKTVPITAERVSKGDWVKRYAHIPPESLRKRLISDKNAYMQYSDNNLYLFHRLHLTDAGFILAVSLMDDVLESAEGFSELSYRNTIWVMPAAVFEEKIGWATPAIPLSANRLLTLIHGVDRETGVYRVFASILQLARDGIVVEAITPSYIMEPRTIYEIYGDRPFTVFPCGAWRLSRNEILISYGAADYSVGLGLIDVDELLSELDHGRIY